MATKRYNLPHLAFFQGFEAAARTLSFTKAAEELFITQSAVSRQIKALEDHLGLKLFERRPRALALTENGQALYRIATDVLDRLQGATDRLRVETRARQLAITTTTGFASLWLIPPRPIEMSLAPLRLSTSDGCKNQFSPVTASRQLESQTWQYGFSRHGRRRLTWPAALSRFLRRPHTWATLPAAISRIGPTRASNSRTLWDIEREPQCAEHTEPQALQFKPSIWGD